MGQSLQMDSGVGYLLYPSSGAANIWRSSRNPKTSPVPFPTAVVVHPDKD